MKTTSSLESESVFSNDLRSSVQKVMKVQAEEGCSVTLDGCGRIQIQGKEKVNAKVQISW